MKINKKLISLISVFIVLCMLLEGCSPSLEDPSEPTATPVHRDITNDTPLAKSVIYANEVANGIQGYFTDGSRSAFEICNQNNLIRTYLSSGEGGLTDIKDKNGNVYLEKSLDVFAYDSNGEKNMLSASYNKGRMNTTRFGYYYYDINIRDYILGGNGEISSGEEIEINSPNWSTNDGALAQNSDGTMTFTVSDSYDPYYYIQRLRISEDLFNAVELKMKSSGPTVTGNLFYQTKGYSGFSQEQCETFSISNDGKYHSYVIPLNNIKGQLLGVRFDMGCEKGEQFTVSSVKAVSVKSPSLPLNAEKTFHTFADKVHFEASLVNGLDNTFKNISSYGFSVKLPVEKIEKINVLSESGENNLSVSDIKSNEYKDARYFAIKEKDLGILGFVFGDTSKKYGVKITVSDGFAEISAFLETAKSLKKGKAISLSARIVTVDSDNFDEIKKICNEERNPFSDIDVTSDDNGRFISYNPAEGVYLFVMDGTDFNTAYYKEKNKYYKSKISIKATDERKIYISVKGRSGSLEGACLMDENNVLVPVPVEVCKNFRGEIEEPIYEPNDDEYGYSIFPAALNAGEKAEYNIYNVYQNWGNHAIKQLSSISFVSPYYHLSTGTTESNCIGPYYIFGKDGWTLPDFRGCSGIMWKGQPQYNSVGRLYFMYEENENEERSYSEFTGDVINSSGLSYADIEYSYISSDGNFEYTLRHVENPSDDENRTYYTVSVRFLKDTEYSDVKNQLKLFTFDGRNVVFKNAAYSDKKGAEKEITNRIKKTTAFYELGGKCPFFTYYNFDKVDDTSGENFALILTDSKVTSKGKKWNGSFAFENGFDGNVNVGSLTFFEDKMTFLRNDTITLNLILLPYGVHCQTNYDNVKYVIEDSFTKKFRVSSVTDTVNGEVNEDPFIPTISTESNDVTFTLTGGRNSHAVKVAGFTKLCVPKVYVSDNGKWKEYNYHTVNGNDGYSVEYLYGKYVYSFVFDMGDSADNSFTYRVVAE